MKKAHILNVRKTKWVLLIAMALTFIIRGIIVTAPNPEYIDKELKTILSFIMPGVLAMLAVYVSGLAIMIGTLKNDIIKEFTESAKGSIRIVIETFTYASKTAASLFTLMLGVYLLLTINYPIGFQCFLYIAVVISFIIIYTLLFLIQFTVYLIKMITQLYNINIL